MLYTEFEMRGRSAWRAERKIETTLTIVHLGKNSVRAADLKGSTLPHQVQGEVSRDKFESFADQQYVMYPLFTLLAAPPKHKPLW